jgi:hypothetical protein
VPCMYPIERAYRSQGSFKCRINAGLGRGVVVSGIGRVDDDSVSNYFKLLHTINCTRQLLLFITPTKWAPAI